ncbi:MAG TPA: hypothetical protein VFA55_03760 [Candidatus Kapabacteria bacterium]|nr:hypothetical protein [Candidatus Kapabacteria bacterium]
MNRIHTITILAALACAALYIACNSNSNSPTSNNNTGGHTFAFTVGSTAQYNQWTLDSTGAKMQSSEQLVHETIIASGFTIAGVSGAYLVVDTIFNGDTIGTVASVDSVYTTTNGTTISQYGIVAKNAYTYSGGIINIPLHWNMVVDQGNTGGWVVDSSDTMISGSSITEKTNGKDMGDTTIMAGGSSLLSNHTQLNGSITITGFGTAPVKIDIYTSYTNPSAPSKYVVAPTKLSSYNIPGSERDLISWTVK